MSTGKLALQEGQKVLRNRQMSIGAEMVSDKNPSKGSRPLESNICAGHLSWEESLAREAREDWYSLLAAKHVVDMLPFMGEIHPN